MGQLNTDNDVMGLRALMVVRSAPPANNGCDVILNPLRSQHIIAHMLLKRITQPEEGGKLQR